MLYPLFFNIIIKVLFELLFLTRIYSQFNCNIRKIKYRKQNKIKIFLYFLRKLLLLLYDIDIFFLIYNKVEYRYLI